MKKCPYCAEEIQDEAIVCRYCGRELVADVQKIVKMKQLQSPTQKELIFDENFLLDDNFLVMMFEKWADSYSEIPDFVTKTILEQMKPITMGLLGEIMTVIFTHNLLSDEEAYALVEKINFSAYSTFFLSYAIGVEQGINKIGDKEPYYLVVFTTPIRIMFTSSIDALSKKGLLDLPTRKKLESNLDYALTHISAFLSNQGWLHHWEFKPKYIVGEKSPFLIALDGLWEYGKETWQEEVERLKANKG